MYNMKYVQGDSPTISSLHFFFNSAVMKNIILGFIKYNNIKDYIFEFLRFFVPHKGICVSTAVTEFF